MFLLLTLNMQLLAGEQLKKKKEQLKVFRKFPTFWYQASNSPTTAGSKSTNTALGTCFPESVSLKKVLKESSPPPKVVSLGIWPSGWIPCSKQYSSQHALPIWTPACPTWIEIHSRCKVRESLLTNFLIFCYFFKKKLLYFCR